MTFKDVLQRGDDFLNRYPRRTMWWRIISWFPLLLCMIVDKIVLSLFYNVKVNNKDAFKRAWKKAERENRGIITIMNHMSMVDEPAVWSTLPWSNFTSLNRIRWCLAADNVVFNTKISEIFFSASQTLETKRFGGGIFQGCIDACIRLLSPDEDAEQILTADEKNKKYTPPIIRKCPSWVHIYPEGFVLQLKPPHNNSMRYFHWGVSRLILESTKSPIVLPIYSTGFEKIVPEMRRASKFSDFLPKNLGSEINVTIGEPIDMDDIDYFRAEWNSLIEKNNSFLNNDLNDELKTGKDAQNLRSQIASFLRSKVLDIRHNQRNLPKEDNRFSSVSWWKKFTHSFGNSDPDIKMIGYNWANRKLQKHLDDFDPQYLIENDPNSLDDEEIDDFEQNILDFTVPLDNNKIKFNKTDDHQIVEQTTILENVKDDITSGVTKDKSNKTILKF